MTPRAQPRLAIASEARTHALPDTIWHDRTPWLLPTDVANTICHATIALTDRAGRRWQTERRAVTDAQARLHLIPADVLPFLRPADTRAYWRDVRTDPTTGSRPYLPDMKPVDLAIRVRAAQTSAWTFVQRRHQHAPGTQPETLATPDGARGLFFPASAPSHRIGVVTMPGSSGGLDAKAAALLAKDGFDVLALGLFGHADLTPHMAMLPLEHVASGIRWLRKRLGHERIALRGISKGSEAAALTAIHFPDLVGALVLWVPSPMATSGRSADGAAALYTLRGEPLPWGSAPFPEDASPAQTTRAKPFAMEVYFEQMWRDPANEQLAFALERATCPILIVSGTDDGLWPSTLAGRMIADRLARHHAPQLVRHVVNQGAGHLFNLPLQVESCARVICHPVQRWWLRAGGTPRANADAALRSWDAMRDFLRTSFDGPAHGQRTQR